MSKFRSLFILFSALLWGLALYGISKIKPSQYAEIFKDTPVIETVPVVPKPPPIIPEVVIPPKPFKERETKAIVKTPIIQTVKVETAPEITPPDTPIIYSPPTPELEKTPPITYKKPVKVVILPPPICGKKDSEPVRVTQFNNSDAYPAAAADDGIEGTATIVAQIDENGRVISASIVEVSNGVFKAKSIIDEAKRQKYKPAIRDCKEARTDYKYTIQFEL